MTKPLPHVVLVHGHDIGRWLSCHEPSVPSPHLTALAERSIVFDNAFSVAPLCTPARSALMTGTRPHVNGLMGLTHNGWRYRPGVVTVPEVLRGAGYQSVLAGFQHEDPDPSVLGYDTVVGQGFLPRALQVAESCEYFLGDRTDERPLFLTAGLWEAHRPWPPEDYDPVDPATVRVPAHLPDNDLTRADLAGFYGALHQFDQALGSLLSSVERHLGLANTVVLVTTDHGAPFPREKSTVYDSGTGVAFVLHVPPALGGVPGRRDTLISHLDVLPTLCDLAGAEVPPVCEGRSLKPLFSQDMGPSDDVGAWPERAIFTEKTYHDGYDPRRAIRTETHKLIMNLAPGPRLPLALDLERSLTRQGMDDAHLQPRPEVELYDLVSDPDELVDLADDPGLAEVRADLLARLERHLAEVADPILSGAIPEPPPATGSRALPPDTVPARGGLS